MRALDAGVSGRGRLTQPITRPVEVLSMLDDTDIWYLSINEQRSGTDPNYYLGVLEKLRAILDSHIESRFIWRHQLSLRLISVANT